MGKQMNRSGVREKRSLGVALSLGVLLASLATIFPPVSAEAVDLMHNSKDTGSTKWPGGWGVPGGRYGNFTCATCHEPNAKNIKNIRKTISVMNNTSTTHTFPNGQLAVNVTFRNVTAMGDDTRAHATSSRICEVCHSQTLYHNADSGRTLPANMNHPTPKAVCTSCHSHNTGFKAACGGCHGNPPTSITLGGYSGMVGTPRPSNALPPGKVGAHRTHAQHSLVCNTCHYISDGSTRMPSLSNSIQIGFFGFGGKVTSGTFVAYSGADRGYPFRASTPNTTMATVVTSYAGANVCTNLYCHGGGVATGGNPRPTLTGGTNTTPDWTGTGQAACGTCHGATANSPVTTGSHIKHAKTFASGNYEIGCAKCHPASDGNSHVQGDLPWKLDTADAKIGVSATYRGLAEGFTGQLAPSAVYGQCANIYCHSDGRGNAGIVTTPTWGDSVGFADCVGCHGGAASTAYPLSQNAHKAHVKNDSPAYNGTEYSCVECHSAVVSDDTTVSDRTLHVNGTKNVNWGSRSTGGMAYNGSCANIYCHSNGQGVYKAPSQAWSAVTDAQEGTAQCNYCHGGINGQFSAVSSNRHRAHIGSVAPLPHAPVTCSGCHARTVTLSGNAIAGGSTGRHINRNLDVNMQKFANLSGAWNKGTATCASTYCHGTQTVTWTNSTVPSCEGCHYSSNYTSGADNSGLSRAHLKHYNSATPPSSDPADAWSTRNRSVATNVFTCGVCHPGNPASTHVNGPAAANGTAAELVSTINLPFTVVKPGANLANTVSRGIAPVIADGRGFQFSSGTTCTTYCHSDGRGGSPKTVASWSATTMACGDCHNKAGDAAPSWSGAHTGHLNSRISDVTCNSCHAGTASGNNALIANRRDRHPNGFINVTGNAVAGPLSYNGDTCSSVYCHPTQSPSWEGGALEGGCSSCHGGNVTSLTPMDTKGHRAHVHNDAGKFKNFNFQCYECHFNTVFSGDTSISTKANHINGTVNIAWGPRANGTGTIAYDPAVKCTTYCHSNGSGKFKLPPRTWNTMTVADEDTIQCDYCHGGIFGNVSTISTGRHTNHVKGVPNTTTIPHKPATCNECHSNTVAADGQSIYNGTDVKHISKAVDVSFMKLGNFSGTWNKSTVTCSNTWCHGSRTGNTWATTTTKTCGSCHEANRNAAYGLSSSHVKHYNTTTRVTAVNGWDNTNNSSNTSAVNIFRCGVCHPGKGEEAIHHVSGPAAANGSAAELVLNLPFNVPAGAARSEQVTRGADGIRKDGAGYMFSQGTSCDTYCHSDAKGGPPKLVMRWAKVTSSCGNCHNKSSDDPATTTWSKPHDMHANKYGNGGSIGSYNTTTNNTFVTCVACHASTATSNTALRTSGGYARHPNGFRNISASSTVGSAAFRWNASQNSCKNGYCHSKAYSFTDYSSTWIKWDQSQAQIHCGSCHTSYPTGPDYANGYKGKANSHPKHVVFWGFTCDWCHNDTVVYRNNSTVISNYRNHVNKNYNVVANSTKVFIGKANSFTATATTNPPTVKTTCTNVNCHGGSVSRVYTWGGTNRCSDCHFATNDTVNYGFKNGTMAMISRTEWSFSGHGKQSGTYSVTGNPFAGFSSAARTAGVQGDPCLYCHEYDTVMHGDTSNPMRLKNFADPTWGKNGVCLICHATGGSSGVTPGTGYTTKTAAKKVDKYHYSNKHSASLSGGQFCWDCHDSHGDKPNSTNGPIAMVHKRPAKASDAVTGMPTAFTAATSVRFTARAAAGDFASTTAPYNGICNVCHDQKSSDPNKMVHYTATSSDGHNAAQPCTDCHKHNADTAYDGTAYKGSGGPCNGCHGANNNGYLSAGVAGTPVTTAGHAIHYNQATVFNSITGSNRHSASAYGFACKNCHVATQHDEADGRADMLTEVNYTFGSSDTSDYTGHIYSTGGTCSTNACHNDGRGGLPVQTVFTWTSAKSADNCGKCHGNPPVVYAQSSSAHRGLTPTTSCTLCHNHFDGSGSILDASLHMNGRIDGGGTACDSCHDYDTRNGGTTWGKGTQFTSGGWGPHAVHINYIKIRWNVALNPASDKFGNAANAGKVCGVCHTNDGSSHSMGTPSNGRQISWGDNLLYPRKFGSNDPIFSIPTRTCSNIDCHYKTSPIWE